VRPRPDPIEWNPMSPKRRLRRRLAAAAAILMLPAAALVAPPPSYGDGDPPPPKRPIINTDGTICWEKRRPGDPRPMVVVSLSEVAKDPITVLFDTADGTAVAPDDYTAIRHLKVTIPAGATSVEVPLDIKADNVTEPDEWFTVTISRPTAGTIGKGTAVVVIKDGGPPLR
jgi:hypothetical protein